MINKVAKEQNGSDYFENIKKELSSYTEKKIKNDATVEVKIINDNYFLTNDVWNIDKINEIDQFKDQYKKAIKTTNNKNLNFKY